MATAVSGLNGIASILGDDVSLLEHQCKTIPKDSLLLPGPDYVDRAYGMSDRSPRVLAALQAMLNTGRLKVGSSRVDLQACKLEYSIVSPK